MAFIVKGFIVRSLTEDKSPIYLTSPETSIFRESDRLDKYKEIHYE